MEDTLIYLDYNACTPVDLRVQEAMVSALRGVFGNPSSSHWAGKIAHRAVEDARSRVSGLIGAERSEIIFTSGGTESNNLAIRGSYAARYSLGRHIITSLTEHPATMGALKHLENNGAEVTYLSVDSTGRIGLGELRDAIRPDTVLITIMHANNETGTLQPIREIASLAKSKGIQFHTDAAQTTGKIEVDVKELDVDMLSLTGQKFYGPKGAGALYVRKGVQVAPIHFGADQENGLRPGTEALPAIVGLGIACEVAQEWLASGGPRKTDMLRQKFLVRLKKAFPDSLIYNGHPESVLPNTLNISIKGVLARKVLDGIPELAASLGSACHSGLDAPSRVLLAMGKTTEESLGAIRFSLGRETTAEELELVVAKLQQTISALCSVGV